MPGALRESFFSLKEEAPLVLYHRKTSSENFLVLYPSSQWQVIQRKTEELAKKLRKPELNRVLNAGAMSISLEENGNGRILIPPKFTDYFKPFSELVFVGNTVQIELWNVELYESNKIDAEASLSELNDEIFDY